ncbi:MAG: hypothetical protein IJE49_00905 [Agathobacter sp.]|nr:hypothetical protein [Agathobacter sp.]
MSVENKYLTDEALTALILEVEEKEFVSAPPEFVSDVMAKITKAEEKRKTVEFRRYCIRVLGSVAAAIALLFWMPDIEPKEIEELPSRQELIGKTITREEALDDRTFFAKLMSNLNQEMGGIFNEAEKEK